jgi:S-disulfanyl-L-cysteine oxidoreductase SoxD
MWSRFWLPLLLAVAGILLIMHRAPAADVRLGIGRPATADEIAGWDIDVRADGQGLPPGRGTVSDGHKIYAQVCAACHGQNGEGKPADQLVGGFGTLATTKPVRTVGSYWPYATTLFDFIRRAMPFNAPQSLSDDQVYAVSAYILYLNKIVPESAVLDAVSMAKVVMPNRNGFTSPDPRPDIRAQ